MDKFNFSIFDTLVYIIPGGLGLIAIVVLLNNSIISVTDWNEIFTSVNIASSIVGLIASYIIGIFFQMLGNNLFNKIYSNKKDKKDNSIGSTSLSNIDISKKQALIREFSSANFTYIELWTASKNMSHNLAISLFLLMTVSIVKIFQVDTAYILEWSIVTIFFAIFTILLIQRAKKFNNWRIGDIDASIWVIEKYLLKNKDLKKSKD